MAIRVKVSDKFQIAVPSQVRKGLGIERGDTLLVDLRDGYAVVMPVPVSYTEHMRGLHREVWEGLDAQEYVDRERDSWGH